MNNIFDSNILNFLKQGAHLWFEANSSKKFDLFFHYLGQIWLKKKGFSAVKNTFVVIKTL